MTTLLETKSTQMSWSERDKECLWHPFTQMQDWQNEEPLVIEQAEGNYLIDVSGRRYLDGVSSLWCNVHGHRVPELDEAIKKQTDKVAHTTFLGLTHPTAIELAEKLVEITPENLKRVFYSDSGSEAAEIAIKIAYQYWQQKGQAKKQKFIKLESAYHGDTIGSVSVGGIDIFHKIFGGLLFETLMAPTPHAYRWDGADSVQQVGEQALAAMEELLKENHEEVAAIIMEPLIQGAAGMFLQPKGYLKGVRDLATKYNILLILDEVATGFGRTGKMFACEHENVDPDIMTLAKGITAGYLPLAVTMVSEEIYGAFLADYEEAKAFFHGHTYTANPLACAVAIANLEYFEKQDVMRKVINKVEYLSSGLERFKTLPMVGDIRQLGLMVGIELVRDVESKSEFEMKDKVGIRVIQKAREKGVILRPLGSVIILMPPLSISKEELDQLLKVTFESILEVAEEMMGVSA